MKLLTPVIGLALFELSAACEMMTWEFMWRGQIAGFMVRGKFCYCKEDIPANGVVREDNLQKLDVSFYDPVGVHLKTYEDNQGDEFVNFAFNTNDEEILQEGTWNVDDDALFYRNGFNMGEGNPALKGQNGQQSGMAFWSRPADNKTPHLHVDDWNDENGDGFFGYPLGYSTHEDVSFPYSTTKERIETGKVGPFYYEQDADGNVIQNNLNSDVDAVGQRLRVRFVPEPLASPDYYSSKSRKKGKSAKKGKYSF